MSSTCEKETHSQRYTPAHGLSTGEMKQFGRQLIVSEFGVSAQERLKHACVLVVGCGGLGSPVILYLAASGVGKVCLVDGDVVESSNLHRQVLFCRQDVGKKKAVAAESAMLQRNGDMSSMAFSVMLTEENAGGLMAEAAPDIIVDCTDSMPTKYLLNRLGVEHGVPVVTGSVIGMEGQVTVFLNNNKKKTKEKKEGEEVEEEQEPPTPNRQACYACLYPTPPPATQKCNDTGVLGPVCGIIGSMEAVECIKVLTDMGADSVRERSRRILHGRMLNFDALTATARTMRLPAANPKCCVCGSRQVGEGGQQSDKHENKEQGKDDDSGHTIDVHAFHERFCTENARERKDFMLIDVRDRVQFDIASFPGSINVPWSSLRRVQAAAARSLVDKARGGDDLDLGSVSTFVLVCRRGVLSGMAVPKLQELYPGASVLHVEGGWELFSAQVDTSFPTY